MAVFLNGEALPEPNARGERVVDDSFLLCFNAHARDVEFVTPDGHYAHEWMTVLDTFDPPAGGQNRVTAGATITVPPRSVIVLQKTG